MANNELTILADIISGKIQSCIGLRGQYYRLDQQLRMHIEKTLSEAQSEITTLQAKIRTALASEKNESTIGHLKRAFEAIQDAAKRLEPMLFDCERNLTQSSTRDPLLSELHRLKTALADAAASIKPTIEESKLKQFQTIWTATGAKREVLEIITHLCTLKELITENYTEYFIRKNKMSPPNSSILVDGQYKRQSQIESEITSAIQALQTKLQPLLPNDLQIVHSDSPHNVPILHRGPIMVCNDLNFEQLPTLVSKDPRILPISLICALYTTHFFEEGTAHNNYKSGPYSISVTMKKLYLLLPVLQQAIPTSDSEQIKDACKTLWERRNSQFSSLVDHLLHTEGFSKYYSKEAMWKD